jgi:hypothetical protein
VLKCQGENVLFVIIPGEKMGQVLQQKMARLTKLFRVPGNLVLTAAEDPALRGAGIDGFAGKHGEAFWSTGGIEIPNNKSQQLRLQFLCFF